MAAVLAMVCRVICCFGVLYFLLNTQDLKMFLDPYMRRLKDQKIRSERIIWHKRSCYFDILSSSSSSRKLIGILNEVSADLPFAICTYDYNRVGLIRTTCWCGQEIIRTNSIVYIHRLHSLSVKGLKDKVEARRASKEKPTPLYF